MALTDRLPAVVMAAVAVAALVPVLTMSTIRYKVALADLAVAVAAVESTSRA